MVGSPVMEVSRSLEEAELALTRKVGFIRNGLAIVAKATTAPEVVDSFEETLSEWLGEFFEARRMIPLLRRGGPIEEPSPAASSEEEGEECSGHSSVLPDLPRLLWEHQRALRRVEARALLAAEAGEELDDARALLAVALRRLSDGGGIDDDVQGF